MSAFISALVPVLVLILLGYGLKRLDFIPEAAWAGMERLTYFLLFPALLIGALGNQRLEGTPWPSILVIVVGTLTMTAVVLLLVHRLRSMEDGAVFTSIFQGGIRFNTYIALTVAYGLYSDTGLALASVAAGFMIVLINLMCISVFAVWGMARIAGVRLFVLEVIGNPLIIACAIGWFLSLSGIGLPGIGADVIEIVGRAALPMGLLVVGASLRPGLIRGHLSPIAVSSLVQFGLKPLTVALLVFYTGLSGLAADVLVIAFIVPTAPSGYILARQLGGDAETMASIIAFQTLLAFFVMPLIALILLR